MPFAEVLQNRPPEKLYANAHMRYGGVGRPPTASSVFTEVRGGGGEVEEGNAHLTFLTCRTLFATVQHEPSPTHVPLDDRRYLQNNTYTLCHQRKPTEQCRVLQDTLAIHARSVVKSVVKSNALSYLVVTFHPDIQEGADGPLVPHPSIRKQSSASACTDTVMFWYGGLLPAGGGVPV